MNEANDSRFRGIKAGFVAALLLALAGCVGYVDAGYSSAVVVPAPDVYVFGGVYERGYVVHEYGRRGAESRHYAHPSGDRRWR